MSGRATASPGSPLSAPVFVHLLPPSGFKGRDGRGPFYYDFAVIAAAHQARGLKLAIDLEHASLEASKTGAAAPAVGWITELTHDATGVYGKVELTETGKTLIESGGFKYLSPVFQAERADSGRISALLGAGLTHIPNLSLKPVTMKEHQMNEALLTLLLEVLELPAESEEAAILAALETLKTALADLRSFFDEFQDESKGADDGKGEGETSANASDKKGVMVILSAMRAEQKRLSAAVLTLSANAASAKQAQRLEACAEAGDAAIVAGKIPPASRAYHLASARRDLAAFRQFVAAAPVFAGFDKKSAHKTGGAASTNPAKSPFDVALRR